GDAGDVGCVSGEDGGFCGLVCGPGFVGCEGCRSGDDCGDDMTGDGDGQPFVKVTLDTIYFMVSEVREEVRQLRSDMNDLVNQSAAHEERSRSLERTVWALSGIAAIHSGIVSTAVSN